jgi:hypothetical protein
MLNAGFQYLEQRDANDTITKDGVVGKNSPFATSDNSGIYDIIAEDLRWLKENVDDVKDTSDLEAIKQSVTDMYNDMKNNSSFGEAAAKAQAEEAKKQAQAALESATNAKTYRDDVVAKSTEANETLTEIKTYIDKAEKLVESNKALEQSFSDYVTVATNKANEASTSATNAATSETNAKTSETAAKASETASKTSETNAKQYEADAKAHMDATATSASNAKASESAAKTSETNAKASEVNAKTSENNAKQYSISSSNSADLSKKWAESSDSPDSVNDTDSTTGKTQSSKSWALYAKDRAISAFKSETNAKASEIASKTSETNAKTSETNAAKSASNAALSETHAKTSETNSKASEVNAKASESNASTSKSNAATSESNAKSYMSTAKEYMQKAQEALAAAQAIQSIVDTAKADAEKCLADVEAVKESLAKMITYQGSVDNYSDLPTSPQVGYSYNIKNADKEHGVNAGDNVVWNGTDWDNFGGAIDMSLFAELGKDVKFNTVTATLNGNAATATKLQTSRTISLTGNATGSTTFDGSGNVSINTTVNESKHADKATMVNATAPNGGAADLAFGTMAANDYARIRVGGSDNNGWLELATADGGNEPIYARQYVGAHDWPNGRPGTVANEAVLLDGNGNTKFPHDVTAANFKGHLAGNADSATEASKVYGIYTANGGQQGPSFFGKNSAGCLMSNQPINGHDEYKNWLYMDNYDGSDVGGATAIGVSRTETRAYIMSSNADRKQWNRTAELLSSANYNSFAPTKTGDGASGTWGINISGNAATATTADSATKAGNVSGKIYYSSESPSVATDKLFTVKEANSGDDNVPNNGLVIQTGPNGANWNGKLYITDNGTDGVWVGGVSEGKEVGWTRLVENKGSWNINSATATTALNVPTSDVGGNIWIS